MLSKGGATSNDSMSLLEKIIEIYIEAVIPKLIKNRVIPLNQDESLMAIL